MQDRQITPADEAQQRMPFSALYQNEPPYGTSPSALPSASSDAFYPNIEKLYIFRDANEVTGFLEENPFLIPLLVEAYAHIKEYFPDSDVCLEVAHDPELIGQKQLITFIVVGPNVENASQTLDHLDENWWLGT